MDKNYFVYILLTERNTFYCGYTDDIEKRFFKHKIGKAAKYTKANKPIKILYQKTYNTRQEAMKEEFRIKKLSRKKKEELINQYARDVHGFS